MQDKSYLLKSHQPAARDTQKKTQNYNANFCHIKEDKKSDVYVKKRKWELSVEM